MPTSRDARNVVTPDAFRVDPALLGVRLASPVRRLAGLLTDLTIASIGAGIGGAKAGLLVGILFLLNAAYKSRPSPRSDRSFFGRWSQASMGLTGAFILFVTALTLVENGANEESKTPYSAAAVIVEEDEDLEESREELQEALSDAGIADDDMDAILQKYLPPDVREQLGTVFVTPESKPVTEDERIEGAQLLSAYATAFAANDSLRLDSLQKSVEGLVAGERIALLQSRITSLDDRVEALEDENERLEEAAANPGPVRLIKAMATDFGLTFGWIGFYLVLFIAFADGRTPGKWLFGMRVVRLDMKPMSFWNAFERLGGYAAGLATGLLGFAQIMWDDNRQGIHDKIAGTVVIRAPRGKLRNTDGV